jgi:hypothetical protein
VTKYDRRKNLNTKRYQINYKLLKNKQNLLIDIINILATTKIIEFVERDAKICLYNMNGKSVKIRIGR